MRHLRLCRLPAPAALGACVPLLSHSCGEARALRQGEGPVGRAVRQRQEHHAVQPGADCRRHANAAHALRVARARPSTTVWIRWRWQCQHHGEVPCARVASPLQLSRGAASSHARCQLPPAPAPRTHRRLRRRTNAARTCSWRSSPVSILPARTFSMCWRKRLFASYCRGARVCAVRRCAPCVASTRDWARQSVCCQTMRAVCRGHT